MHSKEIIMRINIDGIKLDVNNYYYIDKKRRYEYRHYVVKGQTETPSQWTELTAYHYAKQYNVNITKTITRDKSY